ncbi:CPBP family intramembrane metalloprotease [Patescibacteria group bacterium]|nr:CPBP family intramembrane metalloprotease [Patescibacteria group bacterium]
MSTTATPKSSLFHSDAKPWESIPKYLLPIVLIIIVGLIYFISQMAASLILSLYAWLRGMSSIQANNWLTNSVTAQFFYVLLFEGFTVSLLAALMHRYGKSLKTLGLIKVRLQDGGWALLAYAAYFITYLIVIGIITHLVPGLNVNQAQNIGFTNVHGTYQLVLTCISLVILPPLAEELLFRGFLFEGLKKAMPAIYAGLLTSMLFASAHLPEGVGGLFWVGAIDIFILSLALVYLKQKTKSLWPGIFLHAVFNLVAFILLFLESGR